MSAAPYEELARVSRCCGVPRGWFTPPAELGMPDAADRSSEVESVQGSPPSAVSSTTAETTAVSKVREETVAVAATAASVTEAVVGVAEVVQALKMVVVTVGVHWEPAWSEQKCSRHEKSG